MEAVIITCIRKNHADFEYLKVLSVPSSTAIVDGIYWRIPVHNSLGFVTEYSYDASPVKPSADAVKTLRITDSNSMDQYWAVIPDTAGAADFEACRAATTLVGATLASAPIPEPIVETYVAKNDAGNYVHLAVTSALGAGEKYFLGRVSVDGVALAEPTAAGFDTLAALVTWADANNAAAGDFATSGVSVTLTNATKKKIAFRVYKAKVYDSAAAGVHTAAKVYALTVTVNGVATTIKAASVEADGDTVAELVAAANKSVLTAYGTYALVSTNIVRLVSNGSQTGTITLAITEVNP